MVELVLIVLGLDEVFFILVLLFFFGFFIEVKFFLGGGGELVMGWVSWVVVVVNLLLLEGFKTLVVVTGFCLGDCLFLVFVFVRLCIVYVVSSFVTIL